MQALQLHDARLLEQNWQFLMALRASLACTPPALAQQVWAGTTCYLCFASLICLQLQHQWSDSETSLLCRILQEQFHHQPVCCIAPFTRSTRTMCSPLHAQHWHTICVCLAEAPAASLPMNISRLFAAQSCHKLPLLHSLIQRACRLLLTCGRQIIIRHQQPPGRTACWWHATGRLTPSYRAQYPAQGPVSATINLNKHSCRLPLIQQ